MNGADPRHSSALPTGYHFSPLPSLAGNVCRCYRAPILSLLVFRLDSLAKLFENLGQLGRGGIRRNSGRQMSLRVVLCDPSSIPCS